MSDAKASPGPAPVSVYPPQQAYPVAYPPQQAYPAAHPPQQAYPVAYSPQQGPPMAYLPQQAYPVQQHAMWVPPQPIPGEEEGLIASPWIIMMIFLLRCLGFMINQAKEHIHTTYLHGCMMHACVRLWWHHLIIIRRRLLRAYLWELIIQPWIKPLIMSCLIYLILQYSVVGIIANPHSHTMDMKVFAKISLIVSCNLIPIRSIRLRHKLSFHINVTLFLQPGIPMKPPRMAAQPGMVLVSYEICEPEVGCCKWVQNCECSRQHHNFSP